MSEPDDRPITIEELENVIGELHGLAIHLLTGECHANSVRPTALVHTALRRYKQRDQEWSEIQWANRAHFFKTMHNAMRQALIDYARRRQAQRRPKIDFVAPEDIDLYDLPSTLLETPEQIIALDEALHGLTQEEPELAEIVQYHYFTGLSVGELAQMLEASEKTVKRRLAKARLILHRGILEQLSSCRQ